MATVPSVSDRRVSLGRVLNRAFAALGANAVTMFGIAFLFSALPIALLSLWQSGMGPTRDFGTNAVMTGAIYLASFVLTQLAQGGLVRATIAHSDQRRVSFGDCIATGARFALPLLGLGLLLGLALLVGFAFFIVPGVMLYLAWAVAVPSLVVDRSGVFAAFGRSAFLTRGARWNIFGLGLLLLVLYYVLIAAVGVITLAVTGLPTVARGIEGFTTLSTLLTAVSTTITTATVAAIQTSLYVELRDWKDGPQVDQLSEIFA
ncbi:hypothetical protein [Sphingomonas sp. CARO-RG-8B-R24-01]|uniref:hypothetical protein n=1 Tax=Sphingomonas sp. CARO-RG-8B-R24-01 TaxID=2914831 RepID=UPI001F588138|nr:hypothetical protein [Sphingomonas sp. CARO-RG-8B-R24-01]